MAHDSHGMPVLDRVKIGEDEADLHFAAPDMARLYNQPTVLEHFARLNPNRNAQSIPLCRPNRKYSF